MILARLHLPLHFPWRHRLGPLLLGGTLLAPLGCSDDEGSSGRRGPAGPPSLQIAALRPAGGPPVLVPRGGSPTPLCVEPGRDPARTVDVELARIPNFTFSPPSSCPGAVQCGFVVLTVSQPGGPSRRIVSAGRSISVPLGTLGLVAGDAATVTFHAELFRAATNGVLVSDDGGTYSDEVTVRLATSCSESGDGGGPDGAAPADGGDASPGDAALPEGGDAGPEASDASTGEGGPDDGGASDGGREASTSEAGPADASTDSSLARDATRE